MLAGGLTDRVKGEARRLTGIRGTTAPSGLETDRRESAPAVKGLGTE